MFIRLRRIYHKLSFSLRIALIGVLSCWFFIGISTIIANTTNLPFEDSWTSLFPGIDTGNYSEMHFSYGGNDFAGIIFWLTGEQLSTPQQISIASQTINCDYKLKWLYYNNMRWRRLRPLDTGTLATLSSQPWYTNLSMTWGLFTHCVWAWSPTLQDVYGQIDHTFSGITYRLIAGVRYNFATNTIVNGSLFSGTLKLSMGVYSGFMFDTYGGIALVSSGSSSVAFCGNGSLEWTEQCDDGNSNNNDGCSAACSAEIISGSLCAAAFTAVHNSNINAPITFTLNSPWTWWVQISGFQWAFTTTLPSWYSSFVYSTWFASTGTYTGTIIFSNKYIPTLTGSCPWSASIVSGFALCQSFDINTGLITTGDSITFTCNGQNVTGYLLQIFSGSSVVYQSWVYTQANQYVWNTWSALPVWSYSASCTALTGVAIGPQCTSSTLFAVTWHTVLPPPPPVSCTDIPSKTINILGSSLLSGNSGMYYTNQSWLNMQVTTDTRVNYTITGQILPLQITWTSVGYHQFSPINVNNFNTIFSSFSSGSCTYTWPQFSVYWDTQAPIAPTILTPINASNLCVSTPVSLQWSASPDSGSGVGLSGYQYVLQSTNSVNLIYATVWANTTGVIFSGNVLAAGTYNWVVKAFDKLGNIVPSSLWSFVLDTVNCTGTQAIAFSWMPTPITGAERDTLYTSNTFSILWLTGPTLLTLSKGTLLINNTWYTTTGYVQSGDLLKISLSSSGEYNATDIVNFSIGTLTGSRSVSTLDETSCSLSTTQELVASRIYESLKGIYDSDPSKMDSFVSTMKSMLEDEINLTPNCNLDYLLTLINDDDTTQQDTSAHITPSCKEYNISYDNDEYTSPDMRKRIYFVNRESLIRYLDSLNPGDCHQATYDTNTWDTDTADETKHIAPNGKIYHITTSDGIYTSIDFVWSKEFSDLSTMRQYINTRNPITLLWDHEIDTEFTPVTYFTANNKSYKIYKTDKWYMSYKLMKVRYFSTLSEIQTYINKNNKQK